MDDGSQKLLDVIDDPSALESFLGLGEGSDRATLESIVDSLQQGLLEVAGARHSGSGPTQGSLVLTQQQLQQLHHFQSHHLSQQQSASVGGVRQHAVTFTLPSHTAVSSAGTTISSSGTSIPVSTHHFVLAPFPHQAHPATSTPASHCYTTAPISSAPPTMLGSLPINMGPNSSAISGIQIGGSAVGSSGITIGTSGPSGIPGIPVSSGAIFGTSNINLGHSGVLVGPSGTVFQPSALPINTNTGSSPGSPFSVPTRSPAPHAPPTPSPSPLPLRSPAHPPSPTPSPYHSQMQSPQNPHAQSSAGFLLKDGFSMVQPQPAVQGSTTGHHTNFVLSTRDAYTGSTQQHGPVVVLPHQRGPTNTSPQSPYQSQPSPHCPPGGQLRSSNTARSPAPSNASGALTPAPSPSPQHRSAPSVSPVVRSTTPQPGQATVIHQTLAAGLQQFPVVPSGGTTMLQAGNHQLLQIIHHNPSSVPTATFPSHTQIITTAGPGPSMHLQQAPAPNVSMTPSKPKQPPQILPKPPGSTGMVSQGSSHTKLTSSSRGNITTTTQHQGLHTQHTTTGAQMVIGQANQTAMIPTAQGGTLLLNQMIPGLTQGAPVLVQQNANGGMQLILRPPTPGSQGQAQGSKGQPMLISGPQIVHNATASRHQAMQPSQVLRLLTTHGAPLQLQQIQTPNGPTLIAVPSQALSFQHLSQLATAQPQPQQQQVLGPPQQQQQQHIHLQQQQAGRTANTFQIQTPGGLLPTMLGTLPTHMMQSSPSGTATCNGNVGGHSGGLMHHLGVPNSSTTNCVGAMGAQHAGPTLQLSNTGGSNPSGGTVITQHSGATTGQEHFSPVTTPGGGMVRSAQGGMGSIGQQGNMMVIPPPVLAPPKKKPKKKKKKKKDEEPKLDLANLMKLSGIDDEDGMTMYDPEEQTNQSQQQQQQQQQQVIPGGSPGSAGQTQDQQSQLLTQLHTQGGGQPSFKLALEDGKVIFQPDSRGVNSGTSNSTSLLLQNLISSQTQSGAQQSMAAAHSQLTALLGNSPSNQQHVVLSQLLQQSCPSNLPQLVSTGTNTTSQACGSPGSVGGPTGSFNHSLEQTNKTVSPTLTRDAFTEIQPGSKTVVTSSSSRNSFSNLTHGQQHVSGKYLDRMSISLGSGPNAPALLMNRDISNVTPSGLHGATHTPISMMVGENNASGSSGMTVLSSAKTVVTNNNAGIQNLGNSNNLLMNSDSSPNLVLSRNSSMSNVPSHSAQANAPIVVSVNSSRSPTNSLRGCGSVESVKVVSPATSSCLDSSTNNKCSGPGPVAFVHPLHHCERPVVGNSMTQTENLIEPSPLQQSKINDSFFPPTSLTHAPKTTVSNTDTSQAFFNLQSFPGLAPSGGTMPLMAACSTTGSGGYTGAEQLVIAHPGGLSSVVATPQLLQCLQQAQGLNMQLTPNMLNKALSGASFTFSSGGGTILIGGDSYNSQVMAGQTKMTSPLNNTKTTLQQQPPQSVLLQQLNTGVRRCSSDSNSSLSLGSPPPVVNQHQSPQIHNHHRKGHQSIETQTVSTNPSFPNTFLDSIVQSHPSLVVNKLGNKQILNIGPVRKPKKPKKNDRNSIKVTPSMNVMPANLVNSANMQNIQQRVCPNQLMVDPIKTNLHDRLFTKSTNLNSQNIMMGSVSTAGDLPCSTSPSFFATSQPYTTAPSRTVLVTSTVNSTVGSCQNPPLNVLCHNSSGHLHTKGSTAGSSSQFGRSVATQSHTNVPNEPSLGHVVISSPSASLALGNSIVTTTASLSTKVSVTNSILTSSQPHACASNAVNCSPGGVPHLVPFPPSSLGGSSAAPGTTQSGGQVLAPGSIIQKVQTIQLTPQNQKHLKAVQLQIESLQNKKQLTPGDSAALQRLYDEQKRILATGKVVPTIPGQHAQGLHFNPPALDGDTDIYSNRHSTYLADLLRHQVSHQSNVSSHHHQQQQQLQPQGPAVRYHHQVGNQVIPFPPPNHHHKNSTSSSITPTTASHTGYRITPAVVQCHGTQTGVGECHQTSMAPLHVDSSSQASLGSQGDKEVELVPVPVPKMSVTVSPIPPPPNKCHSPVVMCEKGTSPIQVQVGTQTALPCEVSPRHKLVPCLPAGDVKPPLSPQVNKTASVPVCVNNSAIINSGGCNSSVSASTTSTVKLAPHLNKPQLTGLAPASPSARAAKSPLRPTISRCDLIEQQLKTDKAGAHAPDTSMPFRDRGDACKRLVRYHVYNEQQVLSQQDLEKADEIFEATAKHLLDKFRQMMNKYRYLLHMESMREVNTSELIMIDRMFVAEEHNILERLKQDTIKVKEEPSTVTVKMEPGTDLREVRVVVQDVMKNQSIKRELEEDHKVTVTAVGSSKRSRPENDEWLEVQRETGRSDVKTEGSGGCAGDSSVLAEDSRQRTSVGPLGQGGTGRDRPRDEGGGEPKRKEGCDSSEPVVTPHRKKRHKPSDGTDDGEGCDDDELNAQVQSAIDSILNLQRSEDGFELPSSLGAATEHAPTGISQDMDGEDTQQFMSPQDEHLLNNGVGDSPEALVVEFSGTGVGEDSGASSDNPDDDPALDEAVRSILTS